LSSIALNIDMLEDELPKDAGEARILLAAVQKELGRLTALTEQYLSIARHRTAKVENEDLRNIITESASFLQRELVRNNVELLVAMPETPVVVPVDEMQVRQVLFNLLRNAQEAMPDGGKVRISLVEEPTGALVLTVEDEGTGIDAAMVETVFDPFVTTKQTGTGLGLAVTRQIVQSHGGRIRCERAEVKGTRFIIELPRRTPPESQTQAASSWEPADST
jgi:signal transduction histidine kinase